MFRRLLIAAAGVALLGSAEPARAQTSISVTGGVTAPVGDLGDATDLGYHVGAGLNLGASTLPVALRFEAAYGALGVKNSSSNIRIISGTANAIFNLGSTRDAPYLIGGLGAYNRSLSSASGGNYGPSKTVLGLNGGGGLRFPLSGISTFFEARYNIMFNDSADGTNYQFIPITFGIMF